MLCVFSAYYVEYEKEYLTFINLQYGALLKRTFEQFCKKKKIQGPLFYSGLTQKFQTFRLSFILG